MKTNQSTGKRVQYAPPQTEFSLLSSIQAMLQGSAITPELTEVPEEW